MSTSWTQNDLGVVIPDKIGVLPFTTTKKVEATKIELFEALVVLEYTF